MSRKSGLEKNEAGTGGDPSRLLSIANLDKRSDNMPDTGHYTDSEQRVNRLTEDPKMTAAVLRDLRDGFGVEDIQVRGTATANYARAVVRRLDHMGLIHDLYRKRKPRT
jgi:hypothetical protein